MDFENIVKMMEAFQQDKDDCLAFLRDQNVSSPEQALANATIVSTIERLDEAMHVASEGMLIMAMMLALTTPTEKLAMFIEHMMDDEETAPLIRMILFLVASYFEEVD